MRDSAIASRQRNTYGFGNPMETAIPETPPTREDWQLLFAAAIEFRQPEPWHWMHDDAVFGAKNPLSGQIG